MINLGKNTETKKNVEINLSKLVSTRLLIQANSGGGKSWLIRRLLEQSHGKIQQIVIDLEGEFSTLREKYDYLLVGKGGEILANIQTAELLAIKLLKLNVSTIVDLSELRSSGSEVISSFNALNGIALHPNGNIFITGKKWPNIFEIKLK